MPEDRVRPDEAAPAGLRPWTPPCVPPELLDDPSRLSHVVVDEIVGNTATIADYGLPDPRRVPAPPVTPPTPGAPGGAASGPP